MVRTVSVLFITLGAIGSLGCDGRPLGPEQPDGGAMVDQGHPGKPLPDARPSNNNDERCVIAVQQGSCCGTVVAATVKQVKEDPCLSSREVPLKDETSPCAVMPEPCTRECPRVLRPPSFRVAPAPGGGCQFVSECASAGECGMYYECPASCISDDCGCGGGPGWDSDMDCSYPSGVLPIWYAEPFGCELLEADRDGQEDQRPGDFAPGDPFIDCVQSWEDSSLMVCGMGPTEPPPSTRYLLWQSSFGVAGTGPALEINEAGGSVRIWINSGYLQPRGAVGWDFEISWSPTVIASFFMSLEAIDLSGLPHPARPVGECSASLYLEYYGKGPGLNFSYGSAADLSPELDALYVWLAEALWPYQNLLPGNYCSFQEFTIECGDKGCDPLTEVCVIQQAHTTEHLCLPVPPGCEMDRSCACLGDDLCTGTFNACVDSWVNDVVSCECLNC